MKLFSVSQANPDKPTQATLESKVCGCVVQMYFKNFLTDDPHKFSELALQMLKLNIKNITLNYKKKVGLKIIFGAYCGNIYDKEPKIPSIELVRKHHIDKGEPQRIVLPAFWNGEYIHRLNLFVDWLSRGLWSEPEVWEAIEYVTITGINDVSAELRVTAADFSKTENTDQAFINAAQKWKDAGYTPQVARDAFAEIIRAWTYFINKPIYLPVLSGLAAFPCIDESGNIVKRKMTPDLTSEFIEHGKNYANFGVQYTALSTVATPPDKVMKSGVSIIYQANAQIFNNNSATKAEFEAMIENGIRNWGEIIEVWESNIRNFPEVINKYSEL